MSKFLVFQCSRCDRFLYAPVLQKTRFCPYCQRVTKVDTSRAQLVDSAQIAGMLVRHYNAGEEVQKFLEACNTTREEINSLVPSSTREELPKKDVSDEEASGSLKLLIRILADHTAEAPISLDAFQVIAERYDLPWLWTTAQLERLTQEGRIIFPKPWMIQYVRESSTTPGHRLAVRPMEEEHQSIKRIPQGEGKTGLRKKILLILEQAKQPITQKQILNSLESGVSSLEVDEVLQELLRQGIIYEPMTGRYKQIG